MSKQASDIIDNRKRLNQEVTFYVDGTPVKGFVTREMEDGAEVQLESKIPGKSLVDEYTQDEIDALTKKPKEQAAQEPQQAAQESSTSVEQQPEEKIEEPTIYVKDKDGNDTKIVDWRKMSAEASAREYEKQSGDHETAKKNVQKTVEKRKKTYDEAKKKVDEIEKNGLVS